jgi:hypothetical protein
VSVIQPFVRYGHGRQEGALPVAGCELEPVVFDEKESVPSADDALTAAWNASKELFCDDDDIRWSSLQIHVRNEESDTVPSLPAVELCVIHYDRE